VIEIRRAEPGGPTTTASEMAVLGAPYIPGAVVEIEAKVVAVSEDGRFARWRCVWMGAAEEEIPVIKDAGDAVPWICRVDRRTNELALVLAGEDGVAIRWWQEGHVTVYA
jgi:hypothetical protein